MISEIIVEYSYEPPPDPPEGEEDWDESLDYPGVCVSVLIPADEMGILVRKFVAPNARIFGSPVTANWGRPTQHNGKDYRIMTAVWSEPTLEASEARARNSMKDLLNAFERALPNTNLHNRLKAREERIRLAHLKPGSTVSAPPKG